MKPFLFNKNRHFWQMLLKCAFPIIAYTVAILSGIYVANYLLLRIGLNEWDLPFAPPPHLPSAGIS